MNFTSLIKESKEMQETSMISSNQANLLSPGRELKYQGYNVNKYESPHIEVVLNSSELLSDTNQNHFTCKKNSKDHENDSNYFSPSDEILRRNKLENEYISNRNNEESDFKPRHFAIPPLQQSADININLNSKFNENLNRRGNLLCRSSDFIEQIPNNIKYEYLHMKKPLTNLSARNNSPRSTSLNRNNYIGGSHRYNGHISIYPKKFMSPQRVAKERPSCLAYSAKQNPHREGFQIPNIALSPTKLNMDRVMVSYNCAPVMMGQPNVQYFAAYPPQVMNTIVYTNMSPQLNNCSFKITPMTGCGRVVIGRQ